jgi:hypothetical protein
LASSALDHRGGLVRPGLPADPDQRGTSLEVQIADRGVDRADLVDEPAIADQPGDRRGQAGPDLVEPPGPVRPAGRGRVEVAGQRERQVAVGVRQRREVRAQTVVGDAVGDPAGPRGQERGESGQGGQERQLSGEGPYSAHDH